MKTWNIEVREVKHVWVEVEAETLEEAKALAKKHSLASDDPAVGTAQTHRDVTDHELLSVDSND